MLKYKVLRGDIFMAKLDGKQESNIIKGEHPVIVVSNDTANKFSPVITVIPITSKRKKKIPAHVDICGFGLSKESTVLTEQTLSIDRSDITFKIGSIAGTDKLKEIDEVLKKQLDVA